MSAGFQETHSKSEGGAVDVLECVDTAWPWKLPNVISATFCGSTQTTGLAQIQGRGKLISPLDRRNSKKLAASFNSLQGPKQWPGVQVPYKLV